MEAELIAIWIVFGIVTAIIAASVKGRHPVGWFFVGVLLGPFGILLAILMSKNIKLLDEVSIAKKERRRCPYCAELVQYEAVKCRFCQSDLRDVFILPKQEE